MRPSHLPRLTALRAFAALFVFAFHVQLQDSWRLADAFKDGYSGVSFFFILSGVVLTWAHPGDVTPGRFYWRRFARIWPATAVAVIAAYLLLGSSLVQLVTNLLLLQPWSNSADVVFKPNPVTWSLGAEALFYLMFPLLVLILRRVSRRVRWLLVTPWAATTGALAIFAGYHPVLAGQNSFQLVAVNNPVCRTGEFVLGVAIGIELARGARSRISLRAAAALLVTALVVLRLIDLPLSGEGGVLIPFYALLLFAAASADLAGRPSFLSTRWAVYAGEVSFAFYLVHQLVLYRVVGTPSRPGEHSGLQSALLVTVALALSCISAVTLHHLVERPAQARLVRGRVKSGAADVVELVQ